MRDARQMLKKKGGVLLPEYECILEYSKEVHEKYPTQRETLETLVRMH